MSSGYYVTFEQAIPTAKRFIEFVNRSKSPWHAVQSVRERLEKSGYKRLNERMEWTREQLKPNSKYYFTRNQSTIVAFSIGGKYRPGNAFKVIGAHTDSPDLRIKPNSAQTSQGYQQVGVQTYGGGLWHTWFDRDLTIAGRAIVRTGDGSSFEHRLFEVGKPILRIPNLAIHLNRGVNDEGFKFNKEKHLLPIIGTAVKEQLLDKKNDGKNGEKHHSVLMDLMAKELQCKPEDIREFELSVTDFAPSTIGGARDEFIFSPRLDNLMSCYCAVESLLAEENSLADDPDIRVIALFDHEEVGSGSAQGAASATMQDVFRRLNDILAHGENGTELYNRSIAKSYIISSDMAHAVHPNYVDKHQEKHRPMMHEGCVLKINANQRYATNSVTSFLIKEIASRHNIPLQEFVVSNDMACGSTIGPIIAANIGVRTLDLGIPQLSMHSIREQCGTVDVVSTIDLFKAFWREFRELDDKLEID